MCVKIERAYHVIVHTYDHSENYFIERKKSFSFFLTDGGIRKKICRINGEELKTNKKRGGKKKCRDQDSNLGYCGHNAVS